MSDLSITYCGLQLKTPVIAGSCGLTTNPEFALRLEEAGAGAVVLKSLFEEQIEMDSDSIIDSSDGFNDSVVAQDYISYYVKQNSLTEYITTLKDLKSRLTIPVIASINCTSAGSWTSFAKTIEEAGADALEINVYIIPGYYETDSKAIEQRYMDIVSKVKSIISIPLILKISTGFTTLAGTAIRLSKTNLDGMVLFNRFLGHDINLTSRTLISTNQYSTPAELSLPITWIGRISTKMDCDIAASTGVHDGDAVIKAILAGATAVQTVSSLYLKGFDVISSMNKRLTAWMEENHYKSIADFRGKCDMLHIDDPQKYEREQFMRYRSDHERHS